MINIDTPAFDRALETDRDGSFHHAVQRYLEQAMGELRVQLQHGLSPLEFERAQKLEIAIQKARDVIRFSASR